jgi:orotidine-5'-phosphate decarboxylase
MKPEERLICALDFAHPEKAKEMVESLEEVVNFFKIGIVLYAVSGPEIVKWLLDKGKKVFLDLKFYDIPETVEKAVAQVAGLGVSFLTIHGNARIIKNAVRGRGNSNLQLLAVTVLTSLDTADLLDLGFPCSVDELVLSRARKATEYGCDGVVAAGWEASLLRKTLGNQLLIVTPGIRPATPARKNGHDLHKRAVTPKEAIAAGANYLVVGRPIIKAQDPRQAAIDIIKEIKSAECSLPG